VVINEIVRLKISMTIEKITVEIVYLKRIRAKHPRQFAYTKTAVREMF